MEQVFYKILSNVTPKLCIKDQSAKNWCIMAEFQTFNLLFLKSRMDVSQILHGLSYKVCSTTLPKHLDYLFYFL